MKKLQILAVLFFAINSGSLFAGKTFRNNDISEVNKLRAHKAQKAVSYRNAGMDTTSPFKSPQQKRIVKNRVIKSPSGKLNFN